MNLTKLEQYVFEGYEEDYDFDKVKNLPKEYMAEAIFEASQLINYKENTEPVNILENEDSTENRLAYLKKKINVEEIFKDNSKNLVDFYKKTKYLQYKWFYNKEGFMHMGLSWDNKFNSSDVYSQIYYIANRFIDNNTKKVLELGSGQSSNLSILNLLNKDIKIYGIDMYPPMGMNNNSSNIELITGDYHDLSIFETNSLDVAFSIESVCYSTNKKKLLEEVYRVLKPGGVYVCFDAYSTSLACERSDLRNEVFELMEKGWRVEKFENIHDWENCINNSGLELINNRDITNLIKPCLKWLSSRVKVYTSFPYSLILKYLPKAVLGNTIAGYCILDAVRSGDLGYFLHVMKKIAM